MIHKKIIPLSLQALILTSTAYAYDESFQNNVYEKYLHTIPVVESIDAQPTTGIDLSCFRSMISGAFKSINIDLRPLNNTEKMMGAIQSSPIPAYQDEVISPAFVEKMELVYNPGETPANHLKHYLTTESNGSLLSTAWGDKRCIDILTQPLSSSTESLAAVEARKELIRALVESPELLKQCSELVQTIGRNQDGMLAFWQEQDVIEQSLKQMIYWSISPLNQKATTIEMKNQINNIFEIVMGINAPLFNVGIISWQLSRNSITLPVQWGILKADPRFFGTAFGVMTAIQLPTAILPSITLLKMRRAGYRAMQNILTEVATCVRSAQELNGLLSAALKDQCLPENLAHLDGSYSTNKEFKKALKSLKRGTFNYKLSRSAYRGRVGLTYQQMRSPEVQAEFAKLLSAVGEIDTCIAVAKKVVASKKTTTPWSFVSFTQEAAPHIKAEGLFNPFINADHAVTNDVEIGGKDGMRMVVMSGPNTGGKSTLMKSLMYTTLLAQTFGVVPARSCTMTPFARLDCYLNIADDTAAGNSGFKAAVLRAKAILENIERQGVDQFSFLILDELFSGTSPEQVEFLTCEFVKRLSEFPNCIAINATHYHKVLGLEKATNGLCANYRMGAVLYEDGTVKKYTYQFEKGISMVRNAHQIAHEEIFAL